MASRKITKAEAATQLELTTEELNRAVEHAGNIGGARDLFEVGLNRRGAKVCVRKWGNGHRFILRGYAHDGSDVAKEAA